MQSFEVEVKSLLGSAERAEEVRRAMKKVDPTCTLQSRNKQLNHYFKEGSLEKLASIVEHRFPNNPKVIISKFFPPTIQDFSVRTRDKDGEVLLVAKASVDDTTSENGIVRMEFEERLPLTLNELDALVLSAGFKYQAKWSREREEYVCRGTNVTLDKNAGYGWLAEFERVEKDAARLSEARGQIRTLMRELGVEELPQDRLERMFAYYNEHWPEYYGTDKVFTVE